MVLAEKFLLQPFVFDDVQLCGRWMDFKALFLKLAKCFRVYMFDFDGQNVHLLAEAVHVVEILEAAFHEMGAYWPCRKIIGSIQYPGVKVPVVCRQCQHFAQLSAAKDPDFLVGGFHGGKGKEKEKGKRQKAKEKRGQSFVFL